METNGILRPFQLNKSSFPIWLTYMANQQAIKAFLALIELCTITKSTRTPFLLLKNSCCQSCNNNNKETILEDFPVSNLYLELIEIQQRGSIITPAYLYSLLSSRNLEIDDILSKLER